VVSVLDAEVAPPEVLHRLAPLAGWLVFSAAGLLAWSGPAENDDRASVLQGMARDGGGLGEVAQAPARAESCADPLPLLRRAAADGPPRELIVTQGEAGLTWLRPDGRVQTMPAFQVPVVDTNGAGDVFHGALLLALSQGLLAEVCVRRAMAAAALACTRAGGAAAAPSGAELDRFLEERR
jgi:sulfofructose kinase